MPQTEKTESNDLPCINKDCINVVLEGGEGE